MNGKKPLAATLLLLIALVPVGRTEAKPPCPSRIISLSLASDEMLVDLLGDRRKIAALTYFASDPSISNVSEKAREIPRIRANLEQVLGKSPDLVIAAGYTNPDIREHLRRAGVRTLVLGETVSLESVKRNVRAVGAAVCEAAAAEELVKGMERLIGEARGRIPRGAPAPEILFYGAPGFTVGGRTTINDMIESSGGVNVAARRGLSGHMNVSAEYVVETDPDIILTSSYNPSHPDFVGRMFSNDAFRGRRIVVLPGKHLDAASHYAARGVSDLVDSVLKTGKNEDTPDER